MENHQLTRSKTRSFVCDSPQLVNKNHTRSPTMKQSLCTTYFIHWIAAYPVDNAIHPLTNKGLIVKWTKLPSLSQNQATFLVDCTLGGCKTFFLHCFQTQSCFYCDPLSLRPSSNDSTWEKTSGTQGRFITEYVENLLKLHV